MLITLIQRKEWDRNGYSGIGYAGFTRDGDVVEFNSDKEHEVYSGATKFDPNRAEEINLVAKIWDGKVRYGEEGTVFDPNTKE